MQRRSSRSVLRGARNMRIKEDVTSAHFMGRFDLSDQIGLGLRGAIGVRYVHRAMRASPNTASATLYDEDEKSSIRGTANWRDRFIRAIPASPGSAPLRCSWMLRRPIM